MAELLATCQESLPGSLGVRVTDGRLLGTLLACPLGGSSESRVGVWRGQTGRGRETSREKGDCERVTQRHRLRWRLSCGLGKLLWQEGKETSRHQSNDAPRRKHLLPGGETGLQGKQLFAPRVRGGRVPTPLPCGVDGAALLEHSSPRPGSAALTERVSSSVGAWAESGAASG